MRSGLLVLLFVSAACAPDYYWAKPGAPEGAFEHDVGVCRNILFYDIQRSETSLNPFSRGITEDAMGRCLNEQGWFLAEKP